MEASVLVEQVPRGHRHRQLVRAAELLEAAPGRLLDVGAGSGWLSEAWEGPGVALDVFAPSRPTVPWVVGSTERLPFASRSFDTIALLASLGAFRSHGALVGALGEVARVLRPGGTVVALASARRPALDALAPHRVRTRWRWRSFEPDQLVDAFAAAGMVVRTARRYGGVRSLAVDWAVTLGGPLLRRTGGGELLQRIGEADAADFASTAENGRYLYVVAGRGS
jgi:SAM-dependent methyltransferase